MHAFANVYKIVILIKTAPEPDSVFNEVAGLQLAALLQKRPQLRCFPVNSVEYLRTPFSQNSFERLFLTLQVHKSR